MSQAGLRQRKKAAAMNLIQKTGLELFAERGFNSVTIEEIAAAAGFSPSTVYRYFATKEGIVIRDEYDEVIEQLLEGELANRDQSIIASIRKALRAIGEGHFVVERETTLARMRLCLQVETLRASSVLAASKASMRYGELIHRVRGVPLAEARVVSSAIVSAILTALVNWYDDGASQPWSVYCDQALDLLESSLASY